MPESSESVSDDTRELIAAIRRGDQPAFHALMAPHAAPLRAIVTVGLDRVLRRVIDPDDVMQEILITVYRKLPDLAFRGPGAFRRWLESIATSRLVDLRRRHFCAKRRETVWSLDEPAGLSPSGYELRVGDGVCCSGPGPSSVAAEHEEESCLPGILASIPEHYRKLIEQVQIQHLPIAAIARASGCRPEAVRKMLARALQACREVRARVGEQKTRDEPAA